MFKVLFATSEAYPFVHTGGLGEVAGSLPLALAELGCDVRVLMPAYRGVSHAGRAFTPAAPVQSAGVPQPIGLARHKLNPRVEFWTVDYPLYFDRPGGPYLDEAGREWPDNAARFALFCQVVAALGGNHGMPDRWRADVVHANDWQAALVPLLLAFQTDRPRTVFTIHNLAYRGLCDYATYEQLGLPPATWHHESLEFYGQCALLKGGLVHADRVTTVSPTYAQEIQTPEYGHGLDGVLRSRSAVLSGILNGIDHLVWNPAQDRFITAQYDASRLIDKRINKRALQAIFSVPDDDGQFVIGTVTRLADQKGIDLILKSIPALLSEPIQWLFLGSGDPQLERWLRELGDLYPNKIGYRIGFDTQLSHAMFAGLDAFLMPSRFEPCGLSQLYSQRYGTVPIVRRTGGLADSVNDTDARIPTGFLFAPPNSEALSAAIMRAMRAYRDSAVWQGLQRNGMAQDFSWTHSAREYLDLYRSITSRAP